MQFEVATWIERENPRFAGFRDSQGHRSVVHCLARLDAAAPG